jgi:hypothetical protein
MTACGKGGAPMRCSGLMELRCGRTLVGGCVCVCVRLGGEGGIDL